MVNPLDTWKQHAEFTQAAKGLTGKGVIPEYGMQTGYDFQKKYNLNPKVSSVLASGWQLGQEGVRGLGKYLTGDPGALKDAWGTAKKQSAQNIEGILAAHAGTLTPEQQQIRNEYLEGVGQKPDAPFIDPTGRNLFTQYYEDDPYAGIEGQTAFLGIPQIYGMITKGGLSRQAIKKAIIRDQIGKQIGKKTRPFITKKIREARGETFGGTGKFKNIATGTKDYGPHTKPKTKPKTKTIPDRGRGNGGGGSRPNKSGRSGFTNPGKGSYGPHKADGGLINFFKNGGYLG